MIDIFTETCLHSSHNCSQRLSAIYSRVPTNGRVKYSHFVRVTFSHLHDFDIVLFREMILTWLCTRRKRGNCSREGKKEGSRQQNDRKGIAVREEARKRGEKEKEEGQRTQSSDRLLEILGPPTKPLNPIFPTLISEHYVDIVVE